MKIRATIRVRNDAILSRRAELGMSQQALATAAGVPLGALLRLESLDYRGPFVVEHAYRIAVCLSLDPDLVLPEAMRGERLMATQSAVCDILPQALLSMCARPEPLPAPDAHLLEAETRQEVIDAVRHLTDVQQKVIARRFGMDGDGPRTLQEIGDELGLTRERIRQIQDKALNTVRNTLEQHDE